MNFEELEEQIKNCYLCELSDTRINTVPGAGNRSAKIMFIGEAPGFNEDQQGVPFVGRAGKILDELLGSIGLKREDVFITNIVKCRPPQNRDPTDREKKICSPYLDKQIELIRPKVIATLGRHSMEYIFEKFGIKEKPMISRVHSQVFKVTTLFGELTIIPFYHPAVATYSPTKIGLLKDDFRVLKDFL